MTQTVMCSRYQKELPALEKAPLPGPMGERLLKEVSAQAWQEWQTLQTMLINEKHLNLMDPDARQYLQGEMDKFLSGEEHERAEGYVPPSK